MDKKQKTIGFIGLGTMGLPMSKNLIEAGYPLVVWNRTESKMEEPVSMGATPAESPKEVAEKSDVVITIVGDSPDVKEVVLGHSGIIEGAKPGLFLIDMTSISPIATHEIADALEEKDVKILDAPVSGGDIGAKKGTLSIMVGGPKEVFKECRPILEVLGKRITYMGDTGSGQATKLCNQAICALHIQAMCEGLTLGAKFGLKLDRLLDVLTAGYANSRILSHLGPKIAEGDFEPGFKMRHQVKDLKNVIASAHELNVSLPGTSLAYDLFRSVKAMGLGEKGTQAFIKVMERLVDEKVE
ncbi:MAG: NAD(P)-dependent oxidoreductase [Candidatus Korarchaeota archaeon]|nr:NAD(P)-dependent oxidoreductase [Candidatus Korarchaeota archaeon]NIU84459.1 NAD-binding protein [Candidatus Thorarchaeota archaeon]NIW12942.1 NAD-binding protein [Candidatus Thorarchaeota archaeon]NIW51906.1 NAD-binding protein [Candidatus Korarchaeota archaeon]